MVRTTRLLEATGFALLAMGVLLLCKAVNADPTKSIGAFQDCNQFNTAQIVALGGPPGFPAGGNYASAGNCGANEGVRCIQCNPQGNPYQFSVLTDPATNNPPGLGPPVSSSCGRLWVGVCRVDEDDNSYCDATEGDDVGVCVDVVEYSAQDVPPNGGGGGGGGNEGP